MTDQQSLSEPAFPAPIATAGSEEDETVRPVGGLSIATGVLIALSIVTEAAMSVSDWYTYQVVRDFAVGVPGVTFATLGGADSISIATVICHFVVLTAAGITFLLWLWRARKNSEILCMAPHRRRRGWTIGSWFCPVVNLWSPQMIVSDIWKTSNPNIPANQFNLARISGTALVTWWWLCFLVGYLIDSYISLTTLRELTLDSLHTTAVGGTVTTVLSAASAVLIVIIMRQITGWQSRPRPSADTTSPVV